MKRKEGSSEKGEGWPVVVVFAASAFVLFGWAGVFIHIFLPLRISI